MPPSIFIDESGNTGRDIYDLQQPLLTYAGIWLTADQATAASAEVDRLVAQHRLQRQGSSRGAPSSIHEVGARWFGTCCVG